MSDISDIKGYHAHVYFDADTKLRAQALCAAAHAEFGVPVGNFHDRPVGPHPMGSCQLTVTPKLFAPVMTWLAFHRDGLIVFAHPDTGDHLRDHVERATWLGAGLDLNLSIFQ